MSQPKRRHTAQSVQMVRHGVSQMRSPTIKTSEKILICVGIIYALSPIDILPDLIPVVGVVDDIAITGGTVSVALAGIIFRAIARKIQKTVDERQARRSLQ